jgi:ADP-ribose pyrophosphatase YjhB (NUDIX family)
MTSAPDGIRYCARCGAPMVTRLVADRPRRACSRCDFVHFTDPKVGVGVLVEKAGRVLLVKRAMSPERGRWSIPAGFLDQGEDPRLTAAREVLEETNLVVEVGELLDVYHNADAAVVGGASIFILYRGRVVGGTLRPGDDAEAAAFFPPNDLPELAFASTVDAIRRWRAGGGR